MEGNFNWYIRVLNIWRTFGIHNAHVVKEWFELFISTCVLFVGGVFVCSYYRDIRKKKFFFSKMTGPQELYLLRGTVQESWPSQDPVVGSMRAALTHSAWSWEALTQVGWSCLQKITAPDLSDRSQSVYGKRYFKKYFMNVCLG